VSSYPLNPSPVKLWSLSNYVTLKGDGGGNLHSLNSSPGEFKAIFSRPDLVPVFVSQSLSALSLSELFSKSPGSPMTRNHIVSPVQVPGGPASAATPGESRAGVYADLRSPP
jgi:hypothetical protein